jgi:DNA-binding ferritin-like protein
MGLNLLCDILKYKIIFLTEEFNLLGRDFIEKYLSNTGIGNDKQNSRIKITKKEDVKQNSSDISIDSITDIEEDNTMISSELRDIILINLDDIIKKGLTRSFYIILKLCPDILQSNFYKDGNILHIINSDISCDILEIILKINPKLINQQNSTGFTPINMYAKYGLTKSITLLLKYNTDYAITDNNNNTFIHTLCLNGYTTTIQAIIRNVVDIINIKNDKHMTPLIIAAMNGHEEIVYILKGLDADMNSVDIYDNTVYHYICNSGICLGLLVPNNTNKFGFTPKDYCKIDNSFYHFQ